MKLIGPDAQRSDRQLKCYKILVYRFVIFKQYQLTRYVESRAQ